LDKEHKVPPLLEQKRVKCPSPTIKELYQVFLCKLRPLDDEGITRYTWGTCDECRVYMC
jgi:hypothetical protein